MNERYHRFSDYSFDPKDWKDMLYSYFGTITNKNAFEYGGSYDKNKSDIYHKYAQDIAKKIGKFGKLEAIVFDWHFSFEIRFENENKDLLSYHDLEDEDIKLLNDKIYKVLNKT